MTTETNPSINHPESLLNLSDNELQALLLEGVSRTFALTIPQLPIKLYPAIANAYLLCRIVDTIEDEVSLNTEQKHYFCHKFIQVVKTGEQAQKFADELYPLLSNQTLIAEHALIKLSTRVIKITHAFDSTQIAALAECVQTMATGMLKFQDIDLTTGLKNMAEMDQYCYYVAGCVGEMLAKLFCHYSTEIAVHRETLLKLSVSFGQGLQMTNILKDIWDDAERNVCWLPQEIFTETGFELSELHKNTNNLKFQAGLEHLINIAQQHLQNALSYTKLLPAQEIGMRKFCLWSIGMALLTLRKIKLNLDFNRSEQVKINRRSVKATIIVTQLTVKHNNLLTFVFNRLSQKIITPDWDYKPQNACISEKTV